MKKGFVAVIAFALLLSVDQIYGVFNRGTLSYKKYYEPINNHALWRVEFEFHLIIKYSYAYDFVSGPSLQIGSNLELLLFLDHGEGGYCFNNGAQSRLIVKVIDFSERDDYIITHAYCNHTYNLDNTPSQGKITDASVTGALKYPPNNNYRLSDWNNIKITTKIVWTQSEAFGSNGNGNNPPQRITPAVPSPSNWNHIIEVPQNAINFQYSVLASDPNGDTMTYKLSDMTEMGTTAQPNGITINSSTGQVTLTSTLSTGVWATQTIVTDTWGNHISIDYILVIKPSTCGNDIIESNEQCEPSKGICCFSWCNLKPIQAMCRFSASNCDEPEYCTNYNSSCPVNKFKYAGFICRPFINEGCDIQDQCNGYNDVCPDTVVAAGEVCRAQQGACDIPEFCGGTSVSCPPDRKYNSSKVCNDIQGDCDKAEVCDNINNDCPVDTFLPNTVVCRGKMGMCDIEEKCTGSSKSCPIDDIKQPSTFICNNATGLCDITEYCTGNSNDCPVDLVAPLGQVCRNITGSCDIQDTCDGVSVLCIDIVKPSTYVCRNESGDCDIEEKCNGVSGICPPNVKKSNSVVCRPKNGTCDTEDRCNGVSDWCPTDTFANATQVCRPANGYCDVAEYCTGSWMTCPAGTISNPNLIVNSGFEINACDFQVYDSCKYYSVDSTSIQGWTISSGNVEILGNNLYIYDGGELDSSLELNGVSLGVVRQTVNTIVGVTYTFSLWYSANPECTSETDKIKSFSIKIGATTIGRNFDVTGRSYTNMGWTYYTTDYIATTATTEIIFTSWEYSPCGNIIDMIEFRVKNLAINSNFDMTPPSSWCGSGSTFCTARASQSSYNSIPSWIVEAGTVDLVRSSYWQVQTSPFSIDLNGDNAGTLSQIINIPIPNNYYVLSFYISGNPVTGCSNPKNRTMTVSLGNFWSSSYSFDTTGKSVSNMQYGSRSAVILIGNVTTAKLTFTSTRTVDNCGVVIDSVSLTPHCPV